MNSNDVDSTSDGSKQSERAKKIYRYVSDTARRIDEATPACKTIPDLFTTYMEGLRQKIRDNCEKLIFTDPLAYGRKALELLWRKAYYETVSIAKKLKIKDGCDDYYIYTHIVCGIGHYHHLIARIITEMDVGISCLDYPPLSYDDDEAESRVKVDDDVRQWGEGTIHSCLIYLGDLSRYQSEMFEYRPSIAARYYLQAVSLDLASGMPYNQLGNLYTDRNHNLDSVCYYIHCLSCSVPFEGAEGNLARLFEKNAQYVETVDATNVEDLEPAERVKLAISIFLTLAEVWFTAKENVDVDTVCSQTAQYLKLCFAYEEPVFPDSTKHFKEYTEMKESETIYPSYLNPDIIFKIVQVCLFCIHKLNENDPSKAFAVKAFTLAIFSQLIQKCLDQMHKYGFQNLPRRRSSVCKQKFEKNEVVEIQTEKESNTEATEKKENKTNGNSSDHKEEKVNGVSKSNGKKTAKRRRRRRVNNDSSEESEESDSSTDGAESTDEDSSSDSDNSFYTDDSRELSDNDIKMKETSDPIQENDNKCLKKPPVNAPIGLDEDKIQQFLRGNNFLPSLKLLQDWILTEPDLIRSCGESGDTMFQSIVDLLNILQVNFTNNTSPKAKPTSSKILQFAKNTSAKLELQFKEIPLPEDVNLRGTEICKFDKDAAEWELLKKFNPTTYEENIIRILNMILFGHHIAKVVPRIRYNRLIQVFFLKKLHQKNAAKVIRKELKKKPQRSPQKAIRNADTTLMRSLGRLWLQSQVRELETAVRGGGRETPPAYLVVDTDALTGHIKLVKQLVKARKFVVLVPTVVLQSIDELKKEVGGARDAIRWLETQLQSGSRFLRTQRPNETKPLPLVKYPRKAPKQVHQFVQIIEFCHHFVANDSEIGDGDKDKIPEKKGQSVLVLLTGSKLADLEEQKDFSYTGVAQSAGVTIDNIIHFFTKWRHLLSKPGNKR